LHACGHPVKASSYLKNRRTPHMVRVLVLSSLVLSLAGCGVVDTGAAAAAEAAAKAEEARQGLQTEARVREQVEAASKAEADQRNAAEAAAQ
jgi:hypothetical protein